MLEKQKTSWVSRRKFKGKSGSGAVISDLPFPLLELPTDLFISVLFFLDELQLTLLFMYAKHQIKLSSGCSTYQNFFEKLKLAYLSRKEWPSQYLALALKAQRLDIIQILNYPPEALTMSHAELGDRTVLNWSEQYSPWSYQFFKRKGMEDEKLARSQLIGAARCGDITTIQKLLARGAGDINHQDTYGKTALMYAVEYGYKEVVVLLLKAQSIRPDILDRANHDVFFFLLDREYDLLGDFIVQSFQRAKNAVDLDLEKRVAYIYQDLERSCSHLYRLCVPLVSQLDLNAIFQKSDPFLEKISLMMEEIRSQILILLLEKIEKQKNSKAEFPERFCFRKALLEVSEEQERNSGGAPVDFPLSLAIRNGSVLLLEKMLATIKSFSDVEFNACYSQIDRAFRYLVKKRGSESKTVQNIAKVFLSIDWNSEQKEEVLLLLSKAGIHVNSLTQTDDPKEVRLSDFGSSVASQHKRKFEVVASSEEFSAPAARDSVMSISALLNSF